MDYLIVVTVILIAFGIGHFSVRKVVEESVMTTRDRLLLALLISMSGHLPFYIVFWLKLAPVWLAILYAGTWALGIAFVKSRILIPFTVKQSTKLFFLVFWKFVKVVFVVSLIVGLLQWLILGGLLIFDS